MENTAAAMGAWQNICDLESYQAKAVARSATFDELLARADEWFNANGPPATDLYNAIGLIQDLAVALRAALAARSQSGVPTALDMVVDLHCAIYGDTWARPETPAEVWEMLLEEVRTFVEKASGEFKRDDEHR